MSESDTPDRRIVIEGHLLVYNDDGGGWIPFEADFGEHTPLDIDPIHISDLQKTGSCDIYIDNIKFGVETDD